MNKALSNEVPLWLVSHLGENVRLTKTVEGYPPGHVGKLVMIDSGVADNYNSSGWRGRSEAYAIVALNDADFSDLSNCGFDEITPVGLHS